MRLLICGWLILMGSLTVAACDDKAAHEIAVIRMAVLKDLFSVEDKSHDVAVEYEKLFTRVGLAGLKEMTEDRDTSIALQAAWELHRKSVRRDPPVERLPDWVFDRTSIERFLKFMAKRLKSEPPAWWRSTLLGGVVFPGEHHAFLEHPAPLPPVATVAVEKDHVIMTSGKQSITIAKADFEKAAVGLDSGKPPVMLRGEALSYIARPAFRGYPFKIVCVDTTASKQLWSNTVWAARRGFSSGPEGVNPIEICREGNTVIVYGAESHGMYVEGFDVTTGECQFRFCTCYWFHSSESWNLK